MREWKNPKMWVLGAEFTEQGGQGGANDGYHYDLYGNTLFGTSGATLNDKLLDPSDPDGGKFIAIPN